MSARAEAAPGKSNSGFLDWEGLLRRGLGPVAEGGLGLTPRIFWGLSPIELRLMLGRQADAPALLGRIGLERLMASYPDQRGEGRNGGS